MVILTGLFCICLFAMIIENKISNSNALRMNREQNLLNNFVVLCLILVAGMRNVGGTDFNVYRIAYNNTPKLLDYIRNFNVLENRYAVFGMEKGFLLTYSIAKTIGLSYYGYIMLYSVTIISIIYFKTRKYTSYYSPIIFIFLYKMFFYDLFVSIRQTTTIAIFMFMIDAIKDRNWKKYYLLWFLCYFTHTASIMLLIIYPIGALKLTKKKLMVLNAIFIPMIIVSYLNLPIMRVLEPILSFDIFSSDKTAEKAANMILDGNMESINWLHTIEYLGIMFFLTKFYDEISEIYPESDIMIKMFICLLPIFTLFRNYALLTRIKDYFTISYGFILTYIGMVKGGKYRQLVCIAAAVWCGFGYFRYINVFDFGILKTYVPNIFLGRSFFD